MAEQARFGLEAQHQALCAGGHDDGIARVLGVANRHLERALGEVDGGDLLGEELGAEASGLLSASHHQIGAHDAVWETGEVLDLGGEHQLAAGLIAGAAGLAFDHERREVGARRVDGSGETGGPGTDDDHVMVAHAPTLAWRALSARKPPSISKAPNERYEIQTARP